MIEGSAVVIRENTRISEHGPRYLSRIRRWNTSLPAGVVAPILVMVFAALTFAVHWQGPTRRAQGDTYWYLRSIQIFRGVEPSLAGRRAGISVCRDINRAHRADPALSSCPGTYAAISHPRYRAIFESRPGYPVLSLPAVALLGPWWGMAATSAMVFVALSLLTYLGCRLSGLSAPAAAIGGCLLAVLPVAYWNSRMLAEGPAMLAAGGALIGGLLVLRDRWARGVWLLVGSLTAACAAKPACGVATALALTAAGLVLGLRPRRWGRRAPGWVVAGSGLVCIGGWLLISQQAGLPSLGETVQDMATSHFKRPDVADPMAVLVQSAASLWTDTAPSRLGLPWPLIMVLPACGYALWRLGARGLLWAGVSLAPIAVVTAHPLVSEYSRLIGPSWIAVALAAAVASDHLRDARGPVRKAAQGPAPNPHGQCALESTAAARRHQVLLPEAPGTLKGHHLWSPLATLGSLLRPDG